MAMPRHSRRHALLSRDQMRNSAGCASVQMHHAMLASPLNIGPLRRNEALCHALSVEL